MHMFEAIRTNQIDLNRKYIINMEGMEKNFDYEILTIYKKAIWLHVCNVRFREEKADANKIRRDYERDLRFYLNYMYN